MTLEGFGTEQIAAQLEKDDVLTPRALLAHEGHQTPRQGQTAASYQVEQLHNNQNSLPAGILW
ncbi:MAG: hypothetical protein ACLR5H_13205 [Oscillospiraceae bacterium]